MQDGERGGGGNAICKKYLKNPISFFAFESVITTPKLVGKQQNNRYEKLKPNEQQVQCRQEGVQGRAGRQGGGGVKVKETEREKVG